VVGSAAPHDEQNRSSRPTVARHSGHRTDSETEVLSVLANLTPVDLKADCAKRRPVRMAVQRVLERDTTIARFVNWLACAPHRLILQPPAAGFNREQKGVFVHRTKFPRTVATILLTVVFLMSPPVFGSSTAAAAADAPSLDGRLGGSLASFERLYGKPIAGTPEDGADFDVPGIGVLFVQFQFAPDPNNPGRVGKRASPESPATVLTIHPNRATANAAADPDPADWSLTEAQKRVKKLLPSDAVLSDFTPSVDRAAQTCASPALAAAFTSVAKAGCEINYVLPTKKTVSYVTVALSAGSDNPASSPANPCAGALAWSRDAGARLDQARELLDQVAALNESDAGAAAALHGLATKFTALADAQAAAAIPPVMTVANDRLTAVLRAYAAAVNQAGDGIAAQDGSVVDAAVANLTGANEAVARATAVIQRGLAGCGLEPGTPVATG
jgi:hypothetical protein